jgi:hypothetical protein
LEITLDRQGGRLWRPPGFWQNKADWSDPALFWQNGKTKPFQKLQRSQGPNLPGAQTRDGAAQNHGGRLTVGGRHASLREAAWLGRGAKPRTI